MPVVTLHPHLLASAAHRLSLRIQSEGCVPALIIGIQSGGAEVARLMRADFEQTPYAEVRISRPSTKQKEQGFMHRLLQRLPLWVCNLLRIVESRVAELRSLSKVPERVGDINIPIEHLPQHGTILLVDDAIDTGATIYKLRRLLQERCPEADIRVAVITVTTQHPLCEADYCLYHNRTLCRFPWSNDYRAER